jgi:hypothetical protein
MHTVVSLLITFVVSLAMALNPTDQQLVPGTNLLSNPGFENGRAPHTFTGATPSIVTSGANLLFGRSSLTWDATASSQHVQSELVTVPAGLGGANCLARIHYRGGDANLAFQVLDAASVVLSQQTLAVQANTVALNLNFVCPAAGTQIRWRVTSTADAALIALDNAKLGDADNLSQVSQAAFVGGMEQVAAANCSYQENTSSGFNNYVTLGTAPSCASAWVNAGTITNLGPTRHEAVYTNMPPGFYQIIVNGEIGNTAGGGCQFRLSDGTNSYQQQVVSSDAGGSYGGTLIYHVNYTTAGDRTFAIQASDNHGGACVWRNSTTGFNASWKFYRFPTASEQAVRLDQTNYDWIDGGPITIQATTTNPTKPSTGISRDKVFYKREGQNLLLRYEYSHTVNTGSNSGNGDYLFLVPPASGCTIDTTKIGTSTVIGIDSGGSNTVVVGSASLSRSNAAGGAGYVSVFSSTQLRFLTSSTATVNVLRAASSAPWFSLSETNINYAAQASVPCVGWQENRGAPLLVGSVTSSSAGAERVERFRIDTTCSASPCTITSQSGFLTSVTRLGTGDYQLNIAPGVFATSPTCVFTTQDAATQARNVGSWTANTVQYRTFATGSGAAVDQQSQGICMGPRVLP